MMIIKRSFSLLELVIVLFLLTIMGSFIGVRSLKAIQKHRFEKGVEKFCSAYRFCHKMALSHQADIYLIFFQDERGLHYSIGTDEKQGLFPNDQKMQGQIKGLQITLNDTSFSSKEFIFTSTGVVLPDGKITFLSSSQNPKEIELSEIVLIKQ